MSPARKGGTALVSERKSLPVAFAFLAALLWGVWWIPIRYLETLGMSGSWSSVAMNSGAALAALVWIFVARVPFRISRRGVLGALLVGLAVTLYSVAITLSDVVRVVLLFYLAPAWGKIIEWAFMGQRWGWVSTLAVLVALLGAYLVLGGEVSLDAINLGDALAVASGMCWAGGAALIFTGGRMNPVSLSLVTALAATLTALLFVGLTWGVEMPPAVNVLGTGIGALVGMIYVLPILLLTLWSAQRLSPAVISFLLTAEILSGVVTGAVFLDEPFGPMQAAGAAMVLLAAALEVVPALARKPA